MDPTEFHAPAGRRSWSAAPKGYAAFVPAPLPPTTDVHPRARPRPVARRRRARRAVRRRRRAARPATAGRSVQAAGGAVLLAHRGRRGQPVRPAPRPGRGGARQRPARPPARGAQLHLDAALRRGEATRGAAVARLHPCAARAPAARRGGHGSHAGRVPDLAELDRSARCHAGHRDLRAGADLRAARRSRRLGGVPAGARQAARPRAVRHAARPVREPPPLRGRQRPPRPPAHHPLPHRTAAAHAASAVSLGVP